MKRKLNKLKILQIVLPFLIAALTTWLGLGEMLRDSDRSTEYISRVFSVLAPSLFAIISIVSNPNMLMSGSWKEAWEQAKDIQLRFLRLMYMFILYLIVLALLVTSKIVKENSLTHLEWVHGTFAFFAVFAFFLSLFWLPFEIGDIQIKRLEQEIAARRNRKQSSGS